MRAWAGTASRDHSCPRPITAGAYGACFVSDIAIFVLKRDVKLQLTNGACCPFPTEPRPLCNGRLIWASSCGRLALSSFYQILCTRKETDVAGPRGTGAMHGRKSRERGRGKSRNFSILSWCSANPHEHTTAVPPSCACAGQQASSMPSPGSDAIVPRKTVGRNQRGPPKLPKAT